MHDHPATATAHGDAASAYHEPTSSTARTAGARLAGTRLASIRRSHQRRNSTTASTRTRWSAIGAAVAVSLGAGGAIQFVDAAGETEPSSFVGITPCRLIDTRPDTQVGPRGTPIGPTEAHTQQVTGSNGDCVVPSTATAVALNVTSVAPTAASFLAVYPADADLPNASSLNWTAGQAPTPNKVDVALSAGGAIKLFNQFGEVDIVADVVGYYVPGVAGPAGPTGATGATGPQGPAGPQGDPGADAASPANVIWVAKSGGDFSGVQDAIDSITDATSENPYLIKVGPGTYWGHVTLKSYVDIEGSGPHLTTLIADGTSNAPDSVDFGAGATINAEAGTIAEVRNLRVYNRSTDKRYGVGIRAVSGGTHTSFRNLVVDAEMIDTGAVGTTDLRVWGIIADGDVDIRHVSVRATGTAFVYGISMEGQTNVADVEITATATGEALAVPVGEGTPRMRDAVIVATSPDRAVGVETATPASQGLFANIDARAAEGATTSIGFNAIDSSPDIRDSLLLGATFSIGHSFNGSPKVANTVLRGPRAATATCINVYDGDFNATTC